MKLRFRGVSLLVLALSLPTLAHAQDAAADPIVAGDAIDTPVANDGPEPAAAPAPTGDPVLDRLNALEARVKSLETENAQLKSAAAETQTRVEKVEVRAAKGLATNGMVPTFSDVTGNTTFKLRGVVDADYVAFNERKGGYDFNNGTGFRRARIGVEGTAFKNFNWRLEADFAGNTVNLQDAFVQYVGIKPLQITLGQFKAPFGLESNNSDNYNTFLERGMFNVLASNIVAERRLGLAAAYVKPNFTLTAGIFGENESIGRAANNANASPTCASQQANNRPNLCDTPDEGWGGNVRATWEPVLEDRKILHFGAAASYRTQLRTATAVGIQASERPSIRVDNGNIIDSGVIPDAKSAFYYGFEAAGVYGPFTLAAEYGHLKIKRDKDLFPAQTGLIPTAGNPSFDGWYVYGTWFITGESRPFKAGNFDRVRPFNNLDGKGGWGALELALRYDQANVSDTPIAARHGNKAHALTAGLNWYWNPFIKLQLNYIRFAGTNTPLDPIGNKTAGDAFAARLHFDW
jgi:phosphate-selective porin OprO/OprP